MTKDRRIIINGFDVDVVNFGRVSFYYPAFNGNAEFPVTSKGFRQLSHYLRFVKHVKEMMANLLSHQSHTEKQ